MVPKGAEVHSAPVFFYIHDHFITVSRGLNECENKIQEEISIKM